MVGVPFSFIEKPCDFGLFSPVAFFLFVQIVALCFPVVLFGFLCRLPYFFFRYFIPNLFKQIFLKLSRKGVFQIFYF